MYNPFKMATIRKLLWVNIHHSFDSSNTPAFWSADPLALYIYLYLAFVILFIPITLITKLMTKVLIITVLNVAWKKKKRKKKSHILTSHNILWDEAGQSFLVFEFIPVRSLFSDAKNLCVSRLYSIIAYFHMTIAINVHLADYSQYQEPWAGSPD